MALNYVIKHLLTDAAMILEFLLKERVYRPVFAMHMAPLLSPLWDALVVVASSVSLVVLPQFVHNFGPNKYKINMIVQFSLWTSN
jgi:hypothetical protein